MNLKIKNLEINLGNNKSYHNYGVNLEQTWGKFSMKDSIVNGYIRMIKKSKLAKKQKLNDLLTVHFRLKPFIIVFCGDGGIRVKFINNCISIPF